MKYEINMLHFVFKCCMLAFLVPPKVSHFEFSKELNVGDRTSIQCVVGTGDLPLAFTWLKDNVPIKQSVAVGANDNINGDSRYNEKTNSNNINRLSNKDGGVDDNNLIMIRQNDEFTSALSIISIKQSHAGEYTCRVHNEAATILYSAILKVNGTAARRALLAQPIEHAFNNLYSFVHLLVCYNFKLL